VAGVAQAMIARALWRAAVADAWAETGLVVAVVPEDENTEEEVRALREHLCAPHPDGPRASAPPRERTFCAAAEGGPGDGVALLHAVARQSDLGGELARARDGAPHEAFYGAVWGVHLSPGRDLVRWAEDCLYAVWPRGGGPRAPGHLHLLVLLTCPHPGLGQPPLPEGAELVVSQPATPGDLATVAEGGVRHLWPGARPEEVAFLRGGLLDMAAGRRADLDVAIATLADRLTLADVRGGAPVAWSPGDTAVGAAREALAALGFPLGSLAWRPAPGMRESDLRGALWAVGLWQPPAEDWFAGLTTRAWAALGAAPDALAIEQVILEVLRRCLRVERLCRQVLLAQQHAPDTDARLWAALLNRSADGIYMAGLGMRLRRWYGQGLGQGLQFAAAAGLDLGGAGRQPGEELLHPRLHGRLGREAGVGGDLLARPGPDRLVRVEVGAVGRQAQHPQAEIRRGQVVAHRLAAVGRAVVPDHDERAGMVGAQLPQEGGAGRGRARACPQLW